MLFYAVVSLADVSSELLLFEKESHPPVTVDHYDKSVIVDEFSKVSVLKPPHSLLTGRMLTQFRLTATTIALLLEKSAV
jgi:hypothetical protein